jgi:hypothetical protein
MCVGNRTVEAPQTEDASRSASEPVSASLHICESAIPPERVKPATGGGATSQRIRRARRGDSGRRVSRDWPGTREVRHIEGDGLNGGREDITVHGVCRKSDRLIVASKRGNSRGAKGPDCSAV